MAFREVRVFEERGRFVKAIGRFSARTLQRLTVLTRQSDGGYG